jgi:hypothetical protein
MVIALSRVAFLGSEPAFVGAVGIATPRLGMSAHPLFLELQREELISRENGVRYVVYVHEVKGGVGRCVGLLRYEAGE